MIFVTVGTHEQPFERLLIAVDKLREDGHIMEPVFMQTGPCKYRPRMCGYREYLPFHVMQRMLSLAHLVITHGGDCVMMALRLGKVPIVVPRLKQYGEHVDDHQLHFVVHLSNRGLIVPCIDTNNLDVVLKRWRTLQVAPVHNNTTAEPTGAYAATINELCLHLINFPGF